jgi:hypothetical protein
MAVDEGSRIAGKENRGVGDFLRPPARQRKPLQREGKHVGIFRQCGENIFPDTLLFESPFR